MIKRILSALLALALLCGCRTAAPASGARTEEPVTIGVLLKSMSNYHWKEMRTGMQEAAAERGIDLVLLYPEHETDASQQELMFNDLLSTQPDAILWAPCDSSMGPVFAARAREAGVPLFVVDTPVIGADLPYVGADNKAIGELAGGRMVDTTAGFGQVAVISGSLNQGSHTERTERFIQTVESRSKLEVVAVRDVGSDFDRAMDETARLLDDYPDLAGIFCTSAVMGLGAMEQCKAAFRLNTISIIAVDTQEDALSAVSSGMLQGLITQDGYEVGRLAIKTVSDSLAGRNTAHNVYVSSELLTRRNVDDFINDYLLRRDKND